MSYMRLAIEAETSAVFDGPTSDDLVQAVAGRMQPT
jgi:hypothetical protein